MKVLRSETVKVDAGTFDTIVLQPIIKSGGLFAEGGEALIWVTDDDRRIMVQLKAKMPVLRTLDLFLKSYTPPDDPSGLSTPEADLSAVRTVPIARRPNKVRAEEFATPPGDDRSFAAFLDALPDVLAARDFLALVDATSRAAGRAASW